MNLGTVLLKAAGAGLLAWALTSVLIPKDDTDPSFGRSNLQLLVDYRTGCQYLAYHGALTPRLNDEGKQFCR